MELRISPSIGIARLGSSKGQFYLAPETIGGLPFEADEYGNKKGPVINFKDKHGQVRRQGQPFKIFTSDDKELTLDSPNVESIVWNVHLANKKAAWYNYSELEGNLLYGVQNSYANRNVPFRNPDAEDRQKLIVDPGPRTISGPKQKIGFDKASVPSSYKDHASYPPVKVSSGTPVLTLGDLVTDSDGRLIVLGGFGNAGGNEPLTSYGGSSTWHDDISDGPVYCTVTFNDGTPAVQLQAWVIVGSPDFAPEIVNISTLSDTMLDVAVRTMNIDPGLCKGGNYNEDYIANYQRDILPIITRLGRYQWVANVQPMMAFTSNIFDFSDPSESNRANRENYFAYFRQPDDKSNPSPDQPQQQLFRENGSDIFPMMPLNSGSNSVSNETVVKFLALNETQYFLFSQWAKGKFESNPEYKPYPVHENDQASVGNCVGLPMCPGIEVTWSVQNPAIYSDPYIISDQKGMGGYDATGLSPSRDECEGGGCEPGDLTKRMACPWQADFFQCTIQLINFSVPAINKDLKKSVVTTTYETHEKWEASGKSYDNTLTRETTTESNEPLPPNYYSYWWPPQSPWDVIAGEPTLDGEQKSHLPFGQQMNYARGINSFVQMVEHWSALAFIRDRNSGDKGYPFFTETERNHDLFTFEAYEVGQVSGNEADNETTIPVFFIEADTKVIAQKGKRAQLLVSFLEERSFKPISIAKEGLGSPRSGTRNRR
ncbi:MAG: hypothetical protein Aureis2KO_19000 [Aureisphaera sp.]